MDHFTHKAMQIYFDSTLVHNLIEQNLELSKKGQVIIIKDIINDKTYLKTVQ